MPRGRGGDRPPASPPGLGLGYANVRPTLFRISDAVAARAIRRAAFFRDVRLAELDERLVRVWRTLLFFPTAIASSCPSASQALFGGVAAHAALRHGRRAVSTGSGALSPSLVLVAGTDVETGRISAVGAGSASHRVSLADASGRALVIVGTPAISPVAVGVVVCASVFGGALAGMRLRTVLPDQGPLRARVEGDDSSSTGHCGRAHRRAVLRPARAATCRGRRGNTKASLVR
jgi:hypothetical protein